MGYKKVNKVNTLHCTVGAYQRKMVKDSTWSVINLFVLFLEMKNFEL